MIIEYLSNSLLISERDLVSFSLTAPHRYKVYTIPKRNSEKTRTIAHPAKELKFIQRILIDYLSNILPTHDSAFAYKKEKGIKDNAAKHLSSKYLLKMDFKDFFPSVTPELFFTETEKLGITFDEKDTVILTQLLFWKEKKSKHLKLSIGAPSSPFISNFVMYHFDSVISELCTKRKITYTRYADDITFSTKIKDLLFEIPAIVTNTLNVTTKGVTVNPEKTVFTSRGHNRHVTGVTLTNDNKLSIGRNRKKIISSMIHKSQFNTLNTTEAQEILGLISFANHIESDFIDRMIKKYGNKTLENIKHIAAGNSTGDS